VYNIITLDAPISYAIVAGFFIALVVICLAARAKRVAAKKETPKSSAEEIKHSPA
jgi:H+/gluconate symporter-like permease